MAKKEMNKLSDKMPPSKLNKNYLIPLEEGHIGRVMDEVIHQSSLEELSYYHESPRSPINLTYSFLGNCQKYGINVVSVEKQTDLISNTKEFPFGPMGSVFSREVRNGSWPAIWAVNDVTKGINQRCGNSNQGQIGSVLVSGVYVYRDGQWWEWIGD